MQRTVPCHTVLDKRVGLPGSSGGSGVGVPMSARICASPWKRWRRRRAGLGVSYVGSRGGLLFCLALYGTVPCAAYSARQKSMPPRLPTYDTPRPALRLPNRSLGGAQIRALIGTPTPDPPDEPGRHTLLSGTVCTGFSVLLVILIISKLCVFVFRKVSV